MQSKAIGERSLPLASDGVLQRVLALSVVDDGHVHLVHGRLEVALDAVLAPARHPAPRPRAVLELEVEHAVAGGVAGRRDAGAGGQVDGLLQLQDGQVVGEPHGVEAGRLHDPRDGELPVPLSLLLRLPGRVVLDDSHLQQTESKDDVQSIIPIYPFR